jgi:hypothetical protein
MPLPCSTISIGTALCVKALGEQGPAPTIVGVDHGDQVELAATERRFGTRPRMQRDA